MPKGVPNRRYTAEFKTKVIETMRTEGLSYSEAGRRFGIEAHTLLQIWERIYLAEGPEGFAIERRGHSTSARPLKRVTPDREKELLAEVQRLRAENTYLKKLRALVLEDERRRPNKRGRSGDGMVRKRDDGRWEGRYTAGYDPKTGKRIIKNVLGKTQAEAKEKLKVAIAEGQRLDISKAGNYTVALWVRTWYEVYAEPRIRPNTKEYYTNYIENHIVPGIGKIMLDKLTTIQIQRFYNNLQKNGRVQRKGFPELKDKSLSPRVVRGVHMLLSNCLDQAVAERLILVNPAQGCKLPKLEKKEMHILPQERIGMYLAEAERRGLLAAFYLELTAGLRRGELLALLWTDLDAEAKTISVTKQANRIKGELVVSPPKTQSSVRTLAIPQQAVDLLIEEHKSTQVIHICSRRRKPEQCTIRTRSGEFMTKF